MLQIVAQLIVQFFPVGKLRNKIIKYYPWLQLGFELWIINKFFSMTVPTKNT